MIPIFGQGAETKISRNTIKIPDFCFRFEEPSHDLPGFFLEIGVVTGITNYRHAPLSTFEWFGDDIKVFACLEGHVHPNCFGKVACPHPRSHDDGFSFDGVPVLSFYADAGVAVLEESLNCNTFNDCRSTLAGTLNQRHCCINR